MYYDVGEVRSFFELLDKLNINYVLEHNIGGELPSNLKYGKDIDILVEPRDYLRYQKLMLEYGYSRVIHPKGRENGWSFLYNMHESCMMQNKKSGLFVDSYAELATKSIGMKAWLPLDKSIQASIWRDKIWNNEERWWQIDNKNLLVHLITRCVFEKEEFNELYIDEIELLCPLLKDASVQEKLVKIFFGFTEVLIEMLQQKQYKNIKSSYLMFKDY